MGRTTVAPTESQCIAMMDVGQCMKERAKGEAPDTRFATL
jgi:hypothetical protein